MNLVAEPAACRLEHRSPLGVPVPDAVETRGRARRAPVALSSRLAALSKACRFPFQTAKRRTSSRRCVLSCTGWRGSNTPGARTPVRSLPHRADTFTSGRAPQIRGRILRRKPGKPRRRARRGGRWPKLSPHGGSASEPWGCTGLCREPRLRQRTSPGPHKGPPRVVRDRTLEWSPSAVGWPWTLARAAASGTGCRPQTLGAHQPPRAGLRANPDTIANAALPLSSAGAPAFIRCWR